MMDQWWRIWCWCCDNCDAVVDGTAAADDADDDDDDDEKDGVQCWKMMVDDHWTIVVADDDEFCADVMITVML